ncbi:alpha/beta hydrolase [Thermomonospora echinospora]|nr:alpha/beta hydrolase-fold protein [Thermomonospora echinospora]
MSAPDPEREPDDGYGIRADDGAVIVGTWFRAPRTLDLAIRSPVLNEVGRARLLLPRGWSPTARRTWPTLWLLHGGPATAGGTSGHTAWTSGTRIEHLTRDLDVLVVMPDGGRCGDHTDWWNHGHGGAPRWETFHLSELRQILDRGYRAGPERAVAGVSTGGRGALAYAARHHGLFRAAASFSGPLDLLRADPAGLDGADLVRLVAETGCPGVDWRRIWGDPVGQRAVWRRHNPYDLAVRLAGVRLYLSAGDGDPVEALARKGTGRLAGRLRRLGIPATVHLYEGPRSWDRWERELRAALPLLLAEIS